ncbi:MAG: hypothetical protein OQJ98_01530 [Candidatus Pacebacteria bacterium]|nr:hypothetical protein [Candidatus Paceibacterota bacterium]
MMQTFYIAARARHRAEEVSRLQDLLREKGLESALDWVALGANGEVKKPYKENPKNSGMLGDLMLEAAQKADLFILLHDQDLEGALMEYGVARYAAIRDSEKRVLVVDLGGRDSIFLHRTNVTNVDSIESLKVWIEENL